MRPSESVPAAAGPGGVGSRSRVSGGNEPWSVSERHGGSGSATAVIFGPERRRRAAVGGNANLEESDFRPRAHPGPRRSRAPRAEVHAGIVRPMRPTKGGNLLIHQSSTKHYPGDA